MDCKINLYLYQILYHLEKYSDKSYFFSENPDSSQVLQNKVKILQQTGTDETLNVKKSKFVKNGLKSKFEADLVIMIDEKYKRLNITHEI